MNLLALILISIFVSSSFQTAQKCNSHLQLLGGIKKVASGVDITKLDLPSIQDDGVRGVLFDLTCNQSQLWTNQNLLDSSYEIPDQVVEASFKVPVSIKKSVAIYQDFREFKKNLQDNNIDANDSLQIVSSLSGTYQLLLDNILNNFTVIEISVQIPAYTVSLNDFKNETKIENFINQLREKYSSPYEQNQFHWQQLIKTFGTHYFQKADFGGTLFLRSFIKNGNINEKTISSISAYLLGRYKKLIGESLTVDESQNLDFDISTRFSSYGGMDTDGLIGKDVLKNYALSVLKRPVILSGKLKSIANLIQNKTFRQQVKVTVEAHQKHAILTEQKTLLETIKQHFHPVMDKINNLSLKVNPDENQVVEVKYEVDMLLSQFLSTNFSSPSPKHLKQLKDALTDGLEINSG